MPWVAQDSFASGELSPSVHGMVSSDQYQSGCYTLTDALLTATGSATKRFGSEDIVSTTNGYQARLFLYVVGARRFVIQFVSQDDDPGDLNTTARQVRVLDAETRAFIDFGDGGAHGPFDATSSAAFYFHHFTATQLGEVYAFQDGVRIVFCHDDLPPIYMERWTGDGVEQWRYGLYARDNPPLVVDYRIPITIAETTSTQLTASRDIFTPSDVTAFFRLGGRESSSPSTFVYGAWWQVTGFTSATVVTGTRVHGVPGPTVADWAGPFLVGGGFSTTISSSSSAALDSRDFTHSAGNPTIIQNQIGTPFTFNTGGGDVLWIITAVTSDTVFTGVRLNGSGGAQSGSGTTKLTSVGFSDSRHLNRPYLRKFPVTPTALTGAATLYCPDAFYSSVDYDNVPWLPDNHEDPFDSTRGGVVFLNGGAFAITGTTNGVLTGGRVYTGTIIKELLHRGPSIQWGLSWSHGVGFPRCGAFHQARAVFGGFEGAPKSIVASKTGYPEDFTTGALASDGMLIEINDRTGGVPVWMESAGDLRIGTTTGEGVIAGAPLTPANVAWQLQTGYGGNNVRPVLVGDSVLFASFHGLREQSFTYDRDSYLAPDLTEIAKHLFEDDHIVEVEYLSHPFQAIITRDASSRIRALSFWRENQVIGWSPWTTPSYPASSGASSDESEIESICAVRTGGSVVDDELWIVRRFISGGQGGAGSTVRRIERMCSEFRVDQSVTDASPTATEATAALFVELTGTYSPRVLLDGEDIGTYASDVDGDVTYPDHGSTPDEAVIGRTIPFRMIPLIQFPGDEQKGATQGLLNGVTAVVLHLRESRGGTVRGQRIATAANNAEQTGWVRIPNIGQHGQSAQVQIAHDLGYRFEVTALNMKVTYGQ